MERKHLQSLGDLKKQEGYRDIENGRRYLMDSFAQNCRKAKLLYKKQLNSRPGSEEVNFTLPLTTRNICINTNT